MGDHDVIEEQDGWVVCRCGCTFSDNTTGEALARHRVHFDKVTVHTPGLADARRALEGGGE